MEAEDVDIVEESIGNAMYTEEADLPETQESAKRNSPKRSQRLLKQRRLLIARKNWRRVLEPMSAKAALAAAERREGASKSAAVSANEQTSRKVTRVLSRLLATTEGLEVHNALVMDDRKVLKALWKSTGLAWRWTEKWMEWSPQPTSSGAGCRSTWTTCCGNRCHAVQ